MIPTPSDDDAPLTDDRTARGRVGRVVGGSYRLVRFLAAGGSGDVYEAEHVRLGKAFAVKLLRVEAQSEAALRRFRREARAIAKVQSEHVVSIVDSGELDDGTPYLAMELLGGEDLRALLRREQVLPVRRAVRIVEEACAGLAAVHAAGLVHRDIKPENLFITRRASGEDWCKLLDFGVAKVEASHATAHGAIIGTLRYMAPEQLADGGQVCAATDLHALGLVLFECLAGRAAFQGETAQELMYLVMNRTPPRLDELRPELPRALVDVIERCVDKSPAARPRSATELQRLLRSGVKTPLEPQAVTLDEASDGRAGTKPTRTRHRWAVPLVGTVLVGTCAYASLTRRAQVSGGSPAPARERAAEPSPASSGSRPVAPDAAIARENAASTTPAAPVVQPSSSARVVPPRPTVSSPRPAAARVPQRETRQLSVGHFDRANPYEE